MMSCTGDTVPYCVSVERDGETETSEEGERAVISLCGSLHNSSHARQRTETMAEVYGGHEM